MKKTILRTALVSSLVLGGVGAYTITTLASANDLPETYETEGLIGESASVTMNEDGTLTVEGTNEETVQIIQDEDGVTIGSIGVIGDASFEFESFTREFYGAEDFIEEMVKVIMNEDGTFTIEGEDSDNVQIFQSEDEDGIVISSVRISE